MLKNGWLTAFAWLVYIFLYAPIIVLVIFSFDDSRLGVTWTGFTIKWYQSLFSDRNIIDALINSLTIASSAVVISTVMVYWQLLDWPKSNPKMPRWFLEVY